MLVSIVKTSFQKSRKSFIFRIFGFFYIMLMFQRTFIRKNRLIISGFVMSL